MIIPNDKFLMQGGRDLATLKKFVVKQLQERGDGLMEEQDQQVFYYDENYVEKFLNCTPLQVQITV